MNRYSFNEVEHIHLLDGQPLFGTTTVLSVIAKPLTWWASGLAVKELSGIDDPSIFTRIKNRKATQDEITQAKLNVARWLDEHKNTSVNDYFNLLDKAYRAHSVKLDTDAKAGIDLHAELERFVKNEMVGIKETYNPQIAPFVNWAQANVKKFLWSEGYCYSEKYWIGGISDVGIEFHDGSLGICDFKSSKAAYPSHFFQIGSYDICITENGALDMRGNLLYKPDKPFTHYIVVPFGASLVSPIFEFDLNGCKDAFLATLTLYKQLQNMEN